MHHEAEMIYNIYCSAHHGVVCKYILVRIVPTACMDNTATCPS